MGDTNIEWTDKTWNPIRGCSRVSEGCRNCYAERVATRFSGPVKSRSGNPAEWGEKPGPFHGFAHIVNGHPAWTGKVELVEKHLHDPLKWKQPCKIFVNSMSDLFHEALQDEAIDRVFAVMALCPQHTFQILTKRPERMLEYFKDIPYRQEVIGIFAGLWSGLDRHYDGPGSTPGYGITWKLPLPNVWLGVSCEDQKTADERIPLLLQTPAAVWFVSYEPALGPVDFSKYLVGHEEHGVDWSRPIGSRVGCCIGWTPPLDWIIVGGESGPGARPFDIAWARNTVAQCKAEGVAVFYKQGGASNACPHDRKGGHIDCFPVDLQVREFPSAIEILSEAVL